MSILGDSRGERPPFWAGGSSQNSTWMAQQEGAEMARHSHPLGCDPATAQDLDDGRLGYTPSPITSTRPRAVTAVDGAPLPRDAYFRRAGGAGPSAQLS